MSVPRALQYSIDGRVFDAPGLAPGLHVVATPIGNLGDITLRALATLAAADAIVCEDTRISRRLLERYSITRTLIAYNDHNAPRIRPELIERLSTGQALALISDAGTPLISDPGFKLVRDAIAAGVAVHALPGPSAALAALVVAGLPTDSFLFDGFLPPKEGARAERLAALAPVPACLIFYETGPRLGESLSAMARTLGDRPAVVARELTKTFETVYRGTLDSLAADFADVEPKGEIVVIVAPPLTTVPAAEDIDTALGSALVTMSVKDAAASVAIRFGLPRRDVYARALELASRLRRKP